VTDPTCINRPLLTYRIACNGLSEISVRLLVVAFGSHFYDLRLLLSLLVQEGGLRRVVPGLYRSSQITSVTYKINVLGVPIDFSEEVSSAHVHGLGFVVESDISQRLLCTFIRQRALYGS
jgi:hypothetical protein